MRLAVIGALVATSSCDLATSEPQYIVYRVTGTARSSNISFTNETDGMDHEKSGIGPDGFMFWQKTVTLPVGKLAYLTAQNDGDDPGAVIVTIMSDGKVLKSAKSSGAYCIASTSVTVGLN